MLKDGYLTWNRICSIDPASDHLNLGFFNGVELLDPAGLLEGTGKSHRGIKAYSTEDIRKEQFEVLLIEAVKSNAKQI